MVIMFLGLGIIGGIINGIVRNHNLGSIINYISYTIVALLMLGNPIVAFSMSFMNSIGMKVGMVGYLTALMGTNTSRLQEYNPIDKIIKVIRPAGTNDPNSTGFIYPQFELRRWGFCGLALRGLLWTTTALFVPLFYCLGAGLNVFPILCAIAVGALMPVFYLLAGFVAHIISKFILRNKKSSPELYLIRHGDIVWGAVVWTTTIGSVAQVLR